ncbi:hypothetical protein BGC_08490 [Burkholderia sp. 3C]
MTALRNGQIELEECFVVLTSTLMSQFKLSWNSRCLDFAADRLLALIGLRCHSGRIDHAALGQATARNTTHTNDGLVICRADSPRYRPTQSPTIDQIIGRYFD